MEAASVLIRAERVIVPAGLTVDVDDLLDGSIGRRWAQYRSGKPWANSSTTYTYRFPPPSRRNGIVVNPRAYPMAELQHFREWLRWVYLPEYFPIYLANKYGADGFQAALPHLRRELPAAAARHRLNG